MAMCCSAAGLLRFGRFAPELGANAVVRHAHAFTASRANEMPLERPCRVGGLSSEVSEYWYQTPT